MLSPLPLRFVRAPRRPPACLLSLLLLSAVIGAAQTPAPPPAGATVATAPAGASEVVQLNPFEVQADSDRGYAALNSNSITRFNTELDKLPISADIFDQTFMDDTAISGSTVEEMLLTYSAGTGFTSSDPGPGSATIQPGDRNGSSQMTLRGLSNITFARDGFMPAPKTEAATTSYDLERVELINGPQALLYGNGSAGGVVNEVSKQARLGHPAFGSVQFGVDEYGDKVGRLDFGAGNDVLAVRVAIADQDLGGRRQNIGGPFSGDYVQLAAKVFGNTTIRVMAETSTFSRIDSANQTLTAASTSNDARNGQYLHYLLATNQIGASATGASGAGPIDNGLVNWSNVDSYMGQWSSDTTVTTFTTLTAETQWTSWLSTQFAVGYDNYQVDYVNNNYTYYAPNNTSNPFTGQWAVGMTSSTNPEHDEIEPGRTKGIRFSALATNDLFGNRAKSQTILGADFFRSDSAGIYYDYFQADSNFNVLTTAGLTTNNGRTLIPKEYWPVNNGPVEYALFNPGAPRITFNGVNYVRQIMNPVNPALISPADPLGVTPGGSTYSISKTINKGIYGVNYTQWLDGRLETLAGFRLADALSEGQTAGSAAPLPPNASNLTTNSNFSFDAGVDYELLSWLRPYVEVSDSYDPPGSETTDPAGNAPRTAHAIGEEIGIKLQRPGGTVSGSLALFHTESQNEQLVITTTLEDDINPSGLNGQYNTPGDEINVNRETEGVQATFTAAPTPNWRMRLSAAVMNGKIQSGVSYSQYYNDQFNENSAGDVTYADGTIVYVNPTFNSKQLTATSSTAGAIPLTVAAMGSSSNVYYANPVAITGQISTSANVSKVLAVVDPVHGSILTGRVGLPISSQQINPGFTPPGNITVEAAGDATTGYPELSANFTSMYTVPSGWIKGFQVGGSFIAGWYNRLYYMFPSGANTTGNRLLLDGPTQVRCDLILGYTRKFQRVTWHTQLNVTNVFNSYDIVVLPNEINGWAGPNNATFNQPPRNYVLSTTLSF